jgi:hypothetical protein
VHKNIGHPIGTFLYAISTMHCMTVSLAQGGEGLGAMWGEEKAREYLRKAGFRHVQTNQLAHDIQNNWYVVRKRGPSRNGKFIPRKGTRGFRERVPGISAGEPSTSAATPRKAGTDGRPADSP